MLKEELLLLIIVTNIISNICHDYVLTIIISERLEIDEEKSEIITITNT